VGRLMESAACLRQLQQVSIWLRCTPHPIMAGSMDKSATHRTPARLIRVSVLNFGFKHAHVRIGLLQCAPSWADESPSLMG